MDSQEAPAVPPPQHQQLQSPLPAMVGAPPPQSTQSQPQPYDPTTSAAAMANTTTAAPFSTANALPMITPNSAGSMMQNPHFPFNPVACSAPKPLDSANYGDGSSPLRPSAFTIEPAKKKRGRPRKCSPDNNISLGLLPTSIAPICSLPQDDPTGGTPSNEPLGKRRGRPPGSGKKQLDALGVTGVSFTPHVITVQPGEDVASKIMAFSQQGPRTICILSANGAVCNVTLRQPALSGGTVTYEGRFEIISLSGSFLLSESNGNHNRTGGLSVSLAGPDGRVLGGGVAGMLVAETPIQIVVGSFIAYGKKSKLGSPSAQPPNMMNFGASGVGTSPSSQGASSESSDENGGSPLSHGSGPYVNSSQPIQNMPIYTNMGWPNSAVKFLPS